MLTTHNITTIRIATGTLLLVLLPILLSLILVVLTITTQLLIVSPVRDRLLYTGGGEARTLYFGESSLFFEFHFAEVHYFFKSLRGGVRFFWDYRYLPPASELRVLLIWVTLPRGF